MIPKLRINSDIILHVVLNSGDSRKFNEIDKLKIFVEKIKSNKHTHQPTKTSTNACCCECKPSEYKLELNSLVTDSNSDVIKVDALFPADAQSVSGVYCLIIQWTEKTEDLIAENDVRRFTFDTDECFELVDNSEDVTEFSNDITISKTISQ